MKQIREYIEGFIVSKNLFGDDSFDVDSFYTHESGMILRLNHFKYGILMLVISDGEDKYRLACYFDLVEGLGDSYNQYEIVGAKECVILDVIKEVLEVVLDKY